MLSWLGEHCCFLTTLQISKETFKNWPQKSHSVDHKPWHHPGMIPVIYHGPRIIAVPMLLSLLSVVTYLWWQNTICHLLWLEALRLSQSFLKFNTDQRKTLDILSSATNHSMSCTLSFYPGHSSWFKAALPPYLDCPISQLVWLLYREKLHCFQLIDTANLSTFFHIKED